MPDNYECTVKINLIQGEPILFKVSVDDERRRNAASRLEKAMGSSYVGLKLPDKLIIVPTHNIQSIEITPPLTTFMLNVVNDASPVGD